MPRWLDDAKAEAATPLGMLWRILRGAFALWRRPKA